MSKHIYNLVHDKEDDRDYLFNQILKPHPEVIIPKQVDLSTQITFPVFNQLNLGSCGANASTADVMFTQKITLILSRLFIYYKTRELMGTLGQDSGVSNRYLMQALEKFGICQEKFFEYIVENFNIAPTEEALADALNHRIKAYHRVLDLKELKQALALSSQPIVAGIEVFARFESDEADKTGVIPYPKITEKPLGGHDILLVGYDDILSRIKFLNSWGDGWGDKGYGYLPYSYLKYIFDMWFIQL